MVSDGRRCTPVRSWMALAVLLAALALWLADTAHAYVYWTSVDGVGRAELDGSHIEPEYIGGLGGEGSSAGIAVDSRSIYWSQPSGSYETSTPVWAGTLDGTGIEQLPLDANLPELTVAGDQLFFTEWGGGIGLLDLTNGDVQRDVIPSNNDVIAGPALSGEVVYDGRLYWSDEDRNRIGSSNLDGSDVNYFNTCAPGALAVAAGHIYWTDWCAFNEIHRADLDGSNQVYDFLPIPGGDVEGIAADSAHIYWIVYGKGSIGRANLDGTDPEMTFISGIDTPTSVAVDSLAGSPSTIDLTASPAASYYGTPVSFTANVSVSARPAGAVQFQVDGADDGDPVPLDSRGHAVYSPSGPLDVGTRISARYKGSRRTSSVSADLVPNIMPARTSLGLSVVSSKGLLHFSTTVYNLDTQVVPFGSVRFYLDGTPIGTADVGSDGRAVLAGAFSPPAGSTVSAHYHDDTAAIPNFADSDATLGGPRTPPPPHVIHAPAPSLSFAGPATVRHDGSVAVKVTPNQAGTISATATTSARLSPRRARGASRSVYGRTSVMVSHAGRYTLVVHPNRRARRALQRGGTFRIRIRVSFRPAAGTAAPAPQVTKAVVRRRQARASG